MDFARNTLTNTTENVQINMPNLINAYDKKGNIINEKNTAENLFITQNNARANYFNELSKQHAKHMLMMKESTKSTKMDEFGNVTYVDPMELEQLVIKQEHLKTQMHKE